MMKWTFLLALGLAACGSPEAPEAAEAPAAEAPAAEPVTVTDEGTEFDPAVPVERMPEGAWYCDMGGEAHYARMHEGDGECARCGMKLHHRE